jgi:hypothetical protein
MRAPAPFIVGAARSGTTLMRFMLDSHSDLAIPPETHFIASLPELDTGAGVTRDTFLEAVTTFPPGAPVWPDFQIPLDQFRAALQRIEPFTIGDGCRAFYQLYAARFGKPRWGDKTPRYCGHLRLIESFLPEAAFVHVIRDGRDVALSLRPLWFSPGEEIETLATYWRESVEAGRAHGRACRRYLEIRYEDLVGDPEPQLRRVCEFLDLEFQPAMLRYYERAPARLEEHGPRFVTDGREVVTHAQRLSQQRMTMQPPDANRAGAWKTSMDSDEATRFRSVAGDLLDELGY